MFGNSEMKLKKNLAENLNRNPPESLMENREELIEELRVAGAVAGWTSPSYAQLADWVIADRRRICGPLVKWKDTGKAVAHWPEHPISSIRETLRLSGLEK